ncbi:hypothetical protein CJU90_1315 [Yarrowia sp. C11]|nr:hypothetical protein CKK34_0040 [Yarrowia sp. E02]KAG5371301.1 hypothetical protein CJU90_1315 [Yarrowia sp. C11]
MLSKKPSLSDLDATLAHKRELHMPTEQERTILFDHDLSQLIQFSIPAGAMRRHTQQLECKRQNANFAPGSELANVQLRSRPGSRCASGTYASSISSGATLTEADEELDPSMDPWEQLPPVHCAISERIVAHGRFQVFTLHNDKVTYIKCGDAVQAILPKLRLWRTSLSQFIFPQPIPGRFWRVELFRSTYKIADDLRMALEQSCCFLDQIKAPELEEGAKEEYIENYLDQLIPEIDLKEKLVSLNPNNSGYIPTPKEKDEDDTKQEDDKRTVKEKRNHGNELDMAFLASQIDKLSIPTHYGSEEHDLETIGSASSYSPLPSPSPSPPYSSLSLQSSPDLDSANSTLSDSSWDISGHLQPSKYDEMFASSSSTLDDIIETFGVEDADQIDDGDISVDISDHLARSDVTALSPSTQLSSEKPQLTERLSQVTLKRSVSQMQLQLSPRTPEQEFQRQLMGSPMAASITPQRPQSAGALGSSEKPRSPIDARSAIRKFYTTGASAVAFIGLRHPFARWNNILETDTMKFKSMDDDWMEINVDDSHVRTP